MTRALPWLLLVYAAASLLHFAHNAELLAEYPNLPPWLTRAQVYTAWAGVTATGLVGYLLYRTGRTWSGLALLAVYAALGLDGLLHYARAPLSAHTPAMNLTIWLEVIAATLSLIAIGGATIATVRRRGALRAYEARMRACAASTGAEEIPEGRMRSAQPVSVWSERT